MFVLNEQGIRLVETSRGSFKNLKLGVKLGVNMKILLVYPEFPDTFWSFKHALPFIRKRASLPPLGLITVAAMLPVDWDVRLMDLNITNLTETALAWADYVFISAMVAQRASAERLISLCRAAGKKTVAGGPLFTSEPEAFPLVDHLVLNEAEMTSPLFLADLKQGTVKRVYVSGEFSKMENTPIPRWDLLDLKAYAAMSVQWSRGCPFNCDFCNVTALFGHRPRVKTAEQIIAELDDLCAAGWRNNVFFVDDNLIGNKKRLKNELLPALIAWQNKTDRHLPFFTEASINLADDEELMRLMVKAGFNRVFIGIETPMDLGLAECNKRQNQGRDLVADVKRIQRAGLEVQGGFIVGFDSDTTSIFARQIEFIQKSGIVTAMVGMLNAPRGTELWQRLKQSGRLHGQMSGDNVDGSTNIDPAMGIDALRDGYRHLMEYLYSPGNYYQRVRTFLKEFKVPKKSRLYLRLDLQHWLAFLRACWHLGLVKPGGRWHFWMFLVWVFFRRLKMLPMAVEMAINGYHFRKVTRSHIR